MIYVYNREKEDYSMLDNNYPIYRGASILGNPYTHLLVKGTKAMFQCKTREEAIEKYDKYFDIMYGNNIEFTKIIDEMYEKYKNGEDIYLECYCGKGKNGEKKCHGEVIEEKLQKRLIKEKYEEHRRKKTK